MRHEITRRHFALVAAAVATTPVWADPVVRSVSVASAKTAGQMGSRPGRPPQQFEHPPMDSGAPAQPVPVKKRLTQTGQLPYTGDGLEREGAVGVTALVTGAAVWWVNRTDPRQGHA